MPKFRQPHENNAVTVAFIHHLVVRPRIASPKPSEALPVFAAILPSQIRVRIAKPPTSAKLLEFRHFGAAPARRMDAMKSVLPHLPAATGRPNQLDLRPRISSPAGFRRISAVSPPMTSCRTGASGTVLHSDSSSEPLGKGAEPKVGAVFDDQGQTEAANSRPAPAGESGAREPHGNSSGRLPSAMLRQE